MNYNHLFYFWIVAREGSIAAACKILHLAQPTISAQLQALERSLDAALFDRSGRSLRLTETGRVVQRYAEDIFSLGREMTDALKGRVAGRPHRLRIGVADVLPKLVAFQLIKPAFELDEPVQVTCVEGQPADLAAQLSIGDLDVVLSDAPIGQRARIRAFSHQLGECDIAIYGAPHLATSRRRGFPQSLDNAPFLLPGPESVTRRELDRWFEHNDIRPRVVGEFEDSALLKVFAEAGRGLFAAPSVIEDAILKHHEAEIVGRVEEVRARFYAISVERNVRHPGVLAITESARGVLFA